LEAALAQVARAAGSVMTSTTTPTSP
jgi:hypothetical protein